MSQVTASKMPCQLWYQVPATADTRMPCRLWVSAADNDMNEEAAQPRIGKAQPQIGKAQPQNEAAQPRIGKAQQQSIKNPCILY